jgi:hypothetical protein
MLRAYFAEHPANPDASAFPMPRWTNGAKLIRYDLANTGDPADVAEAKRSRGETPLAPIPYTDERGRVADFHSLRHALATMIGRAGVPIKLAQTIMRHADPALTLEVYTHAEDSERAAVLEALPALIPEARKAPETGASHGAGTLENPRFLLENGAVNEPVGGGLTFRENPGKVPLYGVSAATGNPATRAEAHQNPPTRE